MNTQIRYRFELLNPRIRCKQHEQFMHSMQKLRARIYLDDGAIHASQLMLEGRYWIERDEECWHFLLIDDRDEVAGCVRYLLHPNTATFYDLLLRRSALAQDPMWGKRLRAAVEADLDEARAHQLWYAELGGWAVARRIPRNNRSTQDFVSLSCVGQDDGRLHLQLYRNEEKQLRLNLEAHRWSKSKDRQYRVTAL